ncbi:hypothetical protein [Acidovorax sp.]|uniref:hypothetical protein n=1 Tax=Acidovorax sp. TaxID=1872122 RepID=UPI002ACEE74F|nr:hypothetical protein [Acidovorax sp.]
MAQLEGLRGLIGRANPRRHDHGRNTGLQKFRAMDIHRLARSEIEDGEHGTRKRAHQRMER